MKVKPKTALAAILLAGASAAAMPAWAADAAISQVDELIVTARRRAESEQKVATALTVISGADMERRNIQTVNDLENSVPSLEVTSQLGGGQPQFRIRGVGMTDYAANNTSTVGVYIDEVAYPYGSMTQGALFDVSRIEVLRGPQGILYGRNTTGGAVSIITNGPTREFDAGVNASYVASTPFTPTASSLARSLRRCRRAWPRQSIRAAPGSTTATPARRWATRTAGRCAYASTGNLATPPRSTARSATTATSRTVWDCASSLGRSSRTTIHRSAASIRSTASTGSRVGASVPTSLT
ncbi:MAG: Plug domain-containing protein [Pseudomonadota bacterium]